MAAAAFFPRVRDADDTVTICLNAAARGSAGGRSLASTAATRLATLEVLLMVWAGVVGRRSTVGRMLGAVGFVYVVSEALGAAWHRERPFAHLDEVQSLVAHPSSRSFPSRHVASGVAMATIAQRAHPRLGVVMLVVAAGLGISRIAAGLHYPSDVLAGALVGSAIGGWLREGRR